jgi:hypothetical protein
MSHMGEKGNIHRILVGKHEQGRTLRRPCHIWNFMKMDLKYDIRGGLD